MFQRFINKLRLGVTILVALFFIGGIGTLLGIGNDGVRMSILEKIVMFILVLILAGVMYLIIYYWYGKDYKCPSCNKPFCLQKTGEEIVSKENVSVLVNTNTRNRNGEVVGSQEQYVPGERITYRVSKVCKKCGKNCYSTCRRDIPRV